MSIKATNMQALVDTSILLIFILFAVLNTEHWIYDLTSVYWMFAEMHVFTYSWGMVQSNSAQKTLSDELWEFLKYFKFQA